MAAPWRKVVGHTQSWEEHVGHYSWWQVPIHVVTLDCGHTKVYRGGSYPSTKARCSDCEKEIPCPADPSVAST